MTGHEASAYARLPARQADRRTARNPPAPKRGATSPGAAAQLSALHRTLRLGPDFQLPPGVATGAPAKAGAAAAPKARATNRTGLPDRLKAGVEALSGISLDSVKVHYNSPKPAQLDAHAYAQGSDIHLASGQERHLPHEAWHVVQQKQGRVQPTIRLKGVAVNNDASLEREAHQIGQMAGGAAASPMTATLLTPSFTAPETIQRVVINYQPGDEVMGKFAINIVKSTAAGHRTIERGALRSYRIAADEDIYLLAHGGGMVTDQYGHSSGSAAFFAGLSPDVLGNELAAHLPNNYAGKVFLLGCSVAGKTGPGQSSFAAGFLAALTGAMGRRGRRFATSFSVEAPPGDFAVLDEGSVGHIPQTKGHSLLWKVYKDRLDELNAAIKLQMGKPPNPEMEERFAKLARVLVDAKKWFMDSRLATFRPGIPPEQPDIPDPFFGDRDELDRLDKIAASFEARAHAFDRPAAAGSVAAASDGAGAAAAPASAPVSVPDPFFVDRDELDRLDKIAASLEARAHAFDRPAVAGSVAASSSRGNG